MSYVIKSEIIKKSFPRILFILILLTWILGIACCYRGSRYEGPVQHVIIISLDTTRTDHVGCYNNNWINTLHLDRIAAESIVFTNYMTVVPSTLASHASLFTGKYPHTHGTPRNGFMVNRENLMLAEILQEAGFHTVGIPGSFALDWRFNFNQGFDYYNEKYDILLGVQGVDQSQRLAKTVTDTAINYLEEKGIPSNLFLFLHYYDPHAPYNPPSPYDKMYKNNEAIYKWLEMTQNKAYKKFAQKDNSVRYAGEVSYMDKHIGRILDFLKKKNILDEAILIITSDHGENFWDHPAFWDHGRTVYQSTMDAICIIRLPNALRAGTRVDNLFANIDVLPTLLKYIGIDIPQDIDGEAIDLTASVISFRPRVRFGQASKPWKRVETDPRWHNINKSRCLRQGNMKYIQTPYAQTEELYDLSTDPYERKNLLRNPTSDISAKATLFARQLQAWAESAHPPSKSSEPKQDKETRRKLKSLGYIK